MNNDWLDLDEVRRRLEKEAAQPTGILFDRLREQGLINDGGEVTGQIRRWDAFLVITEIKHRTGTNEISLFRCLKPVFGMPGTVKIDVSRPSMVDYLKQGKKIVTAIWDKRLEMWKEGGTVYLSEKGFVRTDSSDDPEDNVGSLLEFEQSTIRL